jgi:hypothetical protein
MKSPPQCTRLADQRVEKGCELSEDCDQMGERELLSLESLDSDSAVMVDDKDERLRENLSR